MAETKKKTTQSSSSAKSTKTAAEKTTRSTAPKSTSSSSSKSTKPAASASSKQEAPKGSAGAFRVGAVLLWLGAIVFEILAILVFKGVIYLKFLPQIAQLIILLVLDLICVIIGSQLWKHANRIDPASKKNKVKFWLWNNMGVIVATFAFIPFIVIALMDKKADKKTKMIAVIAAVVALAIGALTSIDYNPISAEEKSAAEGVFTGSVYYTPFGHVYHAYKDCSALNRTDADALTETTVTQAIEAVPSRNRLCSFCAKRMEREGIDMTDIKTDNKTVDEGDILEAIPEAD